MDEQPDEVPGAGRDRGRDEVPEVPEVPGLPLLPGFREMALRRMSAERRRLVADLTAQRRSAGLSQTEVAARMGTSQSAVARLERAGSNPRIETLDAALRATGRRLTLESAPLKASINEKQVHSHLQLTPTEQLATFQASQRNLNRLARRAKRVARASN